MADGVSVSLDIDMKPLLDALGGERAKDALELLTMTVEEDMRPYVKHDTGTLEGSARMNSDFRAGKIVYTAVRGGGEYAGYAYDDPNVGDHEGQNPKATSRWAEAAKADRGEEWAQALADAIQGAVK